MELFNKHKGLIIIGLSVFSSILFFFRKYSRSKLPQRFVERLLIVKSKYEASKLLTEEICFTIENICQDIADFFYHRDHSTIEEMRLLLLDTANEDEYEDLCFETFQLQHQYLDKAHMFLKSYTGILHKNVTTSIEQDLKNKDIIELKLKYRHKRDILPELDRTIVKEAYIYYLKEAERTEMYRAMMSNVRNPQQQQEIFKSMMISTSKAKDRLRMKFKIDPTIINDLVDKHNLREDEDIMKIANSRKLNNQRASISKMPVEEPSLIQN